MSAEVKLVSLPRKSAFRGSKRPESCAVANVQSSDTVWTGGREYRQDVPNAHEDPRWYRVGIASPQPLEDVQFYYRIVHHDKRDDESYLRYSQYDRLHDDDMVEVAQGETFRFWVVVGGDSNKEPSSESSFEVFVQEFAVPVQHALLREISRTALRWIPRPVLQQVALRVKNRRMYQAPELLARLLPWRRTKPSIIELENFSPLAVTATFYIHSDTRQSAQGAVVARSIMQEPLPPGQKHREECRIASPASAKDPVPMRVSADVKLAADRIAQPLAARDPIEIKRIPWGRCWEAYASALAAALLMGWSLFGIPLWIEPRATVTVVLPKLPRSADEKDLNIALRLIGSDPPMEPMQGFAVHRDGDRLTYRFQSRPIFKGFRWGWAKQYELELIPLPKSGAESEFAHYRMEPTPIDGHFSLSDNVVLQNAELPLSYMYRTASIDIPAANPPAPFSYEVLDENGKPISSGRSSREARSITVEVLGNSRDVHVNVRSKETVLQSVDVTLKPGERRAIVWAAMPDSQASALAAGPGGAGVPPKPIAASSAAIDPKTPTPAGDTAPKPPLPTAPTIARAASAAPVSPAPKPISPRAASILAPRPIPGLQQDKVEAWCTQLGDLAGAAGLTAGSRDPDALRFARMSFVKKDEHNYTLTIVPNRDCYVQVYELSPPAEPQPVFGIDPDTRQPLPMSYPGAIARPRRASANVPFTIDRRALSAQGGVIALALHTGTEPADDLAAMLRQVSAEPSLKDWTIGYAALGQK